MVKTTRNMYKYMNIYVIISSDQSLIPNVESGVSYNPNVKRFVSGSLVSKGENSVERIWCDRVAFWSVLSIGIGCLINDICTCMYRKIMDDKWMISR